MKKVLWVDNDPVVRMAGKRLLEADSRYSVALAASGVEAVRMATKDPPALIILDVLMPGIDGLETLKRLRAQAVVAPVMFLTAKTDSDKELLKQSVDMNVVAVIHKPLNPAKFILQVDQLLESSAG